MVSEGPAATRASWEALVCSGRGEVSERPKERDWKSRTRRKAGRGFKSRPLRLDLSLVRGTRNITLRGHVTSPAPRHAEQAGTPLTYPTGIGRRPLPARSGRFPFRENWGMQIGRRDVRLTNLEKIYFPERGLTKGDLVAYYVDVADCVLHHVRRRPIHMGLLIA